MYKCLIITFIFVSVSVFAGVSDSLKLNVVLNNDNSTDNLLTFNQVDSLTYLYYNFGKWDELIKTGKQAIKQKTDFKRLRQRMGYAYFMKADYYAAMKEYEEALCFDKSDIDTRTYLYYCGINIGNDSYARYQVSQLPEKTRKYFGENPVKLIDAIDLEYNNKSNDSQSKTNNKQKRSNPTYWRIGCLTKLCYQLSLYQAFSKYTQSIDSTGTEYNYFNHSVVNQHEYYLALNWKPDTRFEFMLGYHRISTIINDSSYWQVPLIDKIYNKDTTVTLTGNMIIGKITFRYNRFDVGLSASLLSFNKILTQQYTLQTAVTLPGVMSVKLKSKVDFIFDKYPIWVYSQSVGLLPIKKVWIEGNITLGDLKNYADYSGLYLLNSKDLTIFKTGASIFWQVLNKISIVGNYGYEIKQINNSGIFKINYNQHSLSGGIIWKL